MPTFASLHGRVTPDARRFLDFIWSYYLEHGNWATHRVVFGKFKKETVQALVRTLDSALVRETETSNGQKAFQLPLLGILCTSDGSHYRALLLRYLGHMREVFFRQTGTDSVKSTEVQQALTLSAADTALLGRLIFSGFLRSSGGYQPDFSEWGTNLPPELEDLPTDGALDAAFTSLLDKHTGQPQPVLLADRTNPTSLLAAAPEASPLLTNEHGKLPSVLISYFHDSKDHKRWVLELAQRLHQARIDVRIDQWDLGPGDDVAKFMEQGVR